MDEMTKEKAKFFLNISNNITKNSYFFWVIMILKFLPLFVITHDWNISYNRSISYWIRKFTFCEILSSSKFYYTYISLIIILLIILLNLYFFFIFYKIILKSKLLLKLYSFFIFYIFYGFNQYIYSIIAELIFNEKSKDLNKSFYYIIILLCIIIIILIIYANVFICTIFVYIPIFIHNNTLFINPLNKIHYSTALLSIVQGCIQLELDLKFNEMIIIKNIVRALFVLYYLKDFFNFNKYYNRFYLEFLKKFILTLCFFSCLIEWLFYYDYKNKLIILQKDVGIICFKLIVEINLSILFTFIYYYIESKTIMKKISNFHSKNLKSFDYSMVNFFNILYFHERWDLLKDILIKLNNNLLKLVHSPRCHDKQCFYCYKYTFYEFNFEMEIFLEKKKKKEITILQEHFPLLYQFLFKEISLLYDSFQIKDRKRSVPKLFIVITFYMLFERNYVKCLYLIEKTNAIDNGNRKSLYCYQIEFLIIKILSFYKGKEHKTMNLLSSNNDNISKIIIAEDLIKSSLNTIKEIMITFNNEIVNFSTFSKLIFHFIHEYEILTDKINSLFESSKCNIPYSKETFSLYFEYVYGQVPKKLNACFEKFFSLQNSSLIEVYMKDTYLLLFKVKFLIKDINLEVKYASSELISKLRYTSNEFKSLDIKSLFAKTFYKSYKYIITDFLRNGKDIISINNFCLLDKDKYVIPFDIEAISLYTSLGMVLFLKLKPAKEQLFLKTIKNKNRKENEENNNYLNLCGSCLLFTNNNGKVVSLSRGFEDFFHLKYEVLKDNRINIKQLFKLEKLEKKGKLKYDLLDIYNNIIDIFNEKIGLIGEDTFSKSIIEIKEVKENIVQSKMLFKTSVYYEQREMDRENYQKKIYYLFLIDISVKDYSKKGKSNSLYEPMNIDSLISKSNDSVIYNESSNKIIDKILHTSFNQKILYSNKLSYYILEKFFNTSIKSNKEIKKEKYFDDTLEDGKKKDKEFCDNILNVNELNNANDNIDVNRYFLIKNDNFIIRYLASALSFIFPIFFLAFMIYKLRSLADQENYFRGHINFEMVGLTLMDVLSKVIYMQIQGNNLQPKIMENYFNNTFEFHSEKLIKRIYDYNSFYIKFYQFYTGRVVGTDPYFFNLYEKEVLYKIPDLLGNKIETIAQMASIHLTELLSVTILNGPIPIYYNNSEYYYTQDMVKKVNITPLDYYYCASGYVGFLVNFLASYKYYNNEITNYYGTKALDWKISSQRGITRNIIILISAFICYILICFFIFYFQSQKLFARYFISFTQLRFFNDYLYKKTILIYDVIDNHQTNSKIKQVLSKLEFENENEQITTVNYIISGKIENFKQIKIKSYSIKYKIPYDEMISETEEKKSLKKNETTIIASLLKGNSIKSINSPIKNHISISIPNSTKRISHIEPRYQNSDNLLTKFIKDKNRKKSKGKTTIITRNLTSNTTRTNITNTTFTSSINLMNNINNKEIIPMGMIGNRLLSKPIIYLHLFLTLFILGIILINITIIYYFHSLSLVDSFITIMSTFRSLFAEIKFPNEMLLDFLMSILRNEEFYTIYESTPYSEICGQLKSQYYEGVTRHEMFLELSQCWPEFKPTVDTLILGVADKKMKNLINFQHNTEGSFFCENYASFLSKNKNDKRLNDIKLLEDLTYESILNECKNIGHGLNNEGFQTVLVSMYNTLNILYNEFKNKKNRTAEYNIKILNNDNFVMMQLETYYIFSKMSICYYLIMNIDMENAHISALRDETIFLFAQLFIIIIAISIYLYNIIKYGNEIISVQFFNKCILHMILFK